MNRIYQYALIILCGFLGLSFEILAIRLSTSYFGSGLIQTSIIIGVVLVFFSIGNYFSDKTGNFQKKFNLNIFISAIFLCLGLSQMSYHFFANLMTGLDRNLSLLIISIISLGPVSYFISQFSPIFLHQFKDLRFGKIIALGTIGSFFGSVGTSLLLYYFYSVSHYLFINFILFYIFAILINKKNLFILFPFVILSFLVNTFFIPKNIEYESGVSNYNIEEFKGFKGLVINGGKYSSVINSNNESSEYNEYIHRNILSIKRKLNILVLGAGGFTLSLKNKHHNYHYVDIDPKLDKFIKKDFNKNFVGSYIASDARAYIEDNKKTFDVIMLDVFDFNSESTPKHLTTTNFFNSIKEDLNENGIFLFNVIHRGAFGDSEDTVKNQNSLLKVFRSCYFIPINERGLIHFRKSIRSTLSICLKGNISDKFSTDNQY